MPGVMLSLGLFMVAALLLFVGRSAATGGIPLNGEIGIRTRWTKQSAESWKAGHQAAFPVLVATSIVATLSGVVVIATSVALDESLGIGPTAVAAGVGYVATIVLVLIAIHRANDAARAAHPKDSND